MKELFKNMQKIQKNGARKVRHPGGGCVFCSKGFWGFFDPENNRAFFEFTFSEEHQGPPNHVHGGVIATFIDEVMSFATGNFFPCFLGKIEIWYRKPVPLFSRLQLEGEVVKVEGRKIFTRGFIKKDGEVLIEAHGIYIQPKERNDVSLEFIE